jgi:hypothetical protein
MGRTLMVQRAAALCGNLHGLAFASASGSPVATCSSKDDASREGRARPPFAQGGGNDEDDARLAVVGFPSSSLI